MENYSSFHKIQLGLRISAALNILMGMVALFKSQAIGESLTLGLIAKDLLQFLGAFFIIHGSIQLFASKDPSEHWLVYLTSSILKVLVFVYSIKGFYQGHLSPTIFLCIILLDSIWLIPHILTLLDVYHLHVSDESQPRDFESLVKYVRTNTGESLYQMSEDKNILLVFVRHLGCTFCRETVSEIEKLSDELLKKDLNLVFVHMSDPAYAEAFFKKYYKRPVPHISDPSRMLYKSLSIQRGCLYQLFGPKTIIRGFWAGVFKGYGLGAVEGDPFQLGGYFILSKGKIVFSHKTKSADEIVDVQSLPSH